MTSNRGRNRSVGARSVGLALQICLSCYSLRTMSSKLWICPPALYTSYSRGTWISHLTLWEKSLWLTTHFASLSHSCRFRP